LISRREVIVGCGAALALAGIPRQATAAGQLYEVPMDLGSSRLIVTCTIEGKGPFAFGIDTGGAVSVISTDVAEQLGLDQRGLTRLGIGGRYERYPMFEAREIIFGNAFRQERILLAGIDGDGLGRGVSGMLAAGCLTTMDSELNFGARVWRLYPDGGPSRSGWTPHDRAIQVNRLGSPHLFGEVRLGDQTLRCLLDTGAPGTPMFFSKVARRAGIDIDRQNWSPATTNGREARNYRARVPLAIGGLVIDRPLIRVTDEVDDFVQDGLIGLPTIQQLDLATEVKTKRLWTRPSGRPAPRENYNLSGLWIDQKRGAVVAGRVGRGSPAERAGIAPGDRLDGLAFRDMIARLNGRVGQQVALAVTRGGATRNVTLELVDYL
jgi:predicted aspartyl protease